MIYKNMFFTNEKHKTCIGSDAASSQDAEKRHIRKRKGRVYHVTRLRWELQVYGEFCVYKLSTASVFYTTAPFNVCVFLTFFLKNSQLLSIQKRLFACMRVCSRVKTNAATCQ